MQSGGTFAHVTQKLPGAAIHSQLILVAAGAATDFNGDIYFENITLRAIPEKVEVVPPVEPKFWDFEDAEIGLGDRSVEGFWEYPGGFTLDQVSYEPQRRAMKISGLAFDASRDWSEIKLNVPIHGLNLKGYGLFSVELTVQSEAYRKGGGDFRVQPTAIMLGGSFKALGNDYPAKTTDNGDGTSTLLYEIGFWVPYVRPGDRTSHEMADNFITFYNDDRVIFADRTGDIYSHGNVAVLEKEPFVSIVYPVTNKLLAKENFTFQADVKPYGRTVEEIRYTVLKTEVDVPLALSTSGYYEGPVDISNLKNSFYDTVFFCRFSDGTVFESKGSLTVKK